ncbi:hypothetical protein D3C81_2182300 [compost metagenome]
MQEHIQAAQLHKLRNGMALRRRKRALLGKAPPECLQANPCPRFRLRIRTGLRQQSPQTNSGLHGFQVPGNKLKVQQRSDLS